MVGRLEIHDKNGVLYTGEYMEVLKTWHANTYNEEGFLDRHPNDKMEDYKLIIDHDYDNGQLPIKLVSVTVLDQIGY